MRQNKEKYDIVVSLGGNCAAANALRFRNKRFYSLPFDWTYFQDKQALFNFTEGLKNNFADFLLKENLVSVQENLHGDYLNYFDKKSLYYFPNHFKKEIENESAYQKVYETFKKRCCRLTELLKKSDSVLFILSTKVHIEVCDIEKILEEIKNLFPDLKIMLRVLLFDCEEEEILTGNNYIFCKYKRDLNEYDFLKTNYEWNFADNIEINNFETEGFPKRLISLHLNNYKLKLYLDKNQGGGKMTNIFPLISIGIPAYNHEKYIQEAINSAIAQTYENLELVIIDDGSKDLTWQKICEMKEICEKRFKNVTFLTQNNQGTCITTNKLISLMNGEYYVVCASDDAFTPTLIEELYNAIKEDENYVLAVGDAQAIDENSNFIQWQWGKSPCYKTFHDYFINECKHANFDDKFGDYELLLKGNFIPNLGLTKMSAYKATGGYKKEAPLEDWYINLQLAKQGKFKFVNKVLSLYRMHATNTSKQKNKMSAIAKTTLNYEYNQVFNSNNEELKRKFTFATTQTKRIFKIGNFSLNKEKSFKKKKFKLQLFDKSLTILTINR